MNDASSIIRGHTALRGEDMIEFSVVVVELLLYQMFLKGCGEKKKKKFVGECCCCCLLVKVFK